jgi:branched-chain amino acid transport system substrate-binding protein
MPTRLLALIAVMALVLTACGGGDDATTTADDGGGDATDSAADDAADDAAADDAAGELSGDPVVIGFVAALTGAVAQTSQWQLNMLEIAVDEINADGGVNGRPVEMIVYDSETTPEVAARETQRAIAQDEVCAVIGGYSTPEALAMREVADREEVVFITSSAATPAITEGSQFVFRVAPLSPDLVEGVVRVGVALGVVNPSIMHDSSGTGQFFGPALDETTQANGIPKAGDLVEYPFGASDVSAEVSAVAAQNPDGVFIGGASGAETGLVARAMVDQGLIVPFLGFSPIIQPDAVQISAGAYDELPAVYTVQTVDTTKPEYIAMLETYNEITGEGLPDLPEQVGQAYDTINVLVEALRQTDGDCTGSTLATALEDLPKYVGAAGRTGVGIEFSADNHDGLTGDYVSAYKVEGGEPVIDTELDF